jgi:hypothetical protein
MKRTGTKILRDLNLAHHLARAVALDLARATDLAPDCARGPYTPPLAFDLGRVTDLIPARDLAWDLARDLTRDLTRPLTCDLTRAPARARDLCRALDCARAPAHARDLARDLDAALARITAHEPAATEDRPREVAVTPMACQLVAVAARLLPAAHRARYAEEFQGELWDLAEAGAGRWRQTASAAHQLTKAGHLRTELKAPRRRGASS